MHRDDITVEIAEAIQSAISHYESDRFFFNEKQWTLTTISGEKYYGVDTPSPGTLSADLLEVDSITVTANARIYQLDKASYIEMDSIDAGTTPLAGYPRLWAWYAGKLRLYPTPNDAYVLTISGQAKLDTLSAPSDENAWTNVAENLIRCHAKREIAAHVTYDDQMAARMDGLASRAFADLKAQTNKLISSGKIKSTRF